MLAKLWKKNILYTGFGTIFQARHLLEILKWYHPQIREELFKKSAAGRIQPTRCGFSTFALKYPWSSNFREQLLLRLTEQKDNIGLLQFEDLEEELHAPGTQTSAERTPAGCCRYLRKGWWSWICKYRKNCTLGSTRCNCYFPLPRVPIAGEMLRAGC